MGAGKARPHLKLLLRTVCSVFQLPTWTPRCAPRGQGTSEGLTTLVAASANLCQGKDPRLDWMAVQRDLWLRGGQYSVGRAISYLVAL